MKLGDKVKWNDPAIEEYKELIEDAENRVFTIKEINLSLSCIIITTSLIN